MYKFKNSLLPPSCCHHVLISENDQYSLRRRAEFSILHHRTKMRENYIGIAGPKLWRTLPETITSINSFILF